MCLAAGWERGLFPACLFSRLLYYVSCLVCPFLSCLSCLVSVCLSVAVNCAWEGRTSGETMLVAGSLRSFPQESWSWPALPSEESGTCCSLPILGHASRSAIDSQKNLSSKNIEDRTFHIPCSMFHGRERRRREKVQPNRETVRNPTRTKPNSNKTFCYWFQGLCVFFITAFIFVSLGTDAHDLALVLVLTPATCTSPYVMVLTRTLCWTAPQPSTNCECSCPPFGFTSSLSIS